MIELGRKYRDNVHGIEGIATASTAYLTGCTRVCLERVHDGQILTDWFDETALIGAHLSPAEQKPGGPRPVPPPRATP